jgi:SPOR domain
MSNEKGPMSNERGLFVAKTATHDTEYVDIVLGYHHIFLLSLIFGVLMFGTGYFLGSYRTQNDRAGRTASAAVSPALSLTADARAAELPAAQAPSTGIAGNPAPVPAANGNARPTATGFRPEEEIPAAPRLTAAAAAPETSTARVLNPPPARAAATPAADDPDSERQSRAMPAHPNAGANDTQAAENYFRDDLYQRFRNPQTQDSFKIYLRISSIRAQQEAEALIKELAAEGIRALIEGESLEGRHMVLVGPFGDFQSAESLAKELKKQDLDAFPIRR